MFLPRGLTHTFRNATDRLRRFWSRMVVLDNAGMPTCQAVGTAQTGLAKFDVFPYYLPPYPTLQVLKLAPT